VIAHSRKTYGKPRAEVEKAIIDWHEEGKSAQPAPAPKREGPKPIDIRGPKRNPEERREYPPEPQKPKLSLSDLKEKNNQKRPDQQLISDLMDASRAVVEAAHRPQPAPQAAVPKPPAPPPSPKPEKNEPTAEELKKILGVA